jgi:hypothetical protein
VLPGLERSNVKSCCRNASSRKTSVPLCAARSRESRVNRVAKSGQKIFSQSSRKPCAALRRTCVALLWKEFKRVSLLPLHDFFAARCHVWKELTLSLLYRRHDFFAARCHVWKELTLSLLYRRHDFFAARCHVWKELNLSLLYRRPKTCLGNELHGCKFNINALNALHVHVQNIYI